MGELRGSGIERDEAADVDVLVVGAGPTGLVAAAEALRHGLSVRIIERMSTRGAFSKALVVHARTLEVFATMGIAQEIRTVGAPFAALNTNFANGRRQVRVDLLGLPWGDTAYPFWLSVPQYDTERVLESHLQDLGGAVEWSMNLLELKDRGGHVETVLQGTKGRETVRARWVIGCDGGRSAVREQSGITLSRSGAGATFLLADVKSTSDLVEEEGYVHLAHQGLLLIVPMPEPGRWRLIAHVPPSPSPAGNEAPAVDAGGLDDIIRERAGIEFGSHDVSWTSQFDLSHGVANRFRAGRVFVAGDAAHIHSPVGGQGLNTGVQDSHNLMWKIAYARHLPARQAEDLLDSYDQERRGSAKVMVQGVARMTATMTSRRWLVRRVVGWLAPRVLARRSVQTKLGRGVGMLDLSYAGIGRARQASAVGLRVGSRMLNPELRSGGSLFDHMDGTTYGWVVQGNDIARAPDPSEAKWKGLPVVFLRREDMRDPATYPSEAETVLVRPDLYVAASGTDPCALADGVLAAGVFVGDGRTTGRVAAL